MIIRAVYIHQHHIILLLLQYSNRVRGNCKSSIGYRGVRAYYITRGIRKLDDLVTAA